MSDTTIKWVALELSHQGEKRTPPDLARLIRHEIGEGVSIFVPSVTFSRGETDVTICLMEGYAFVEAGLPPSRYMDMEETPYIRRVLSRDESQGRFLCYVDDEVIQDLRRRLREQSRREVQMGDFVGIYEGAYSALKGRVLEVYEDTERASIHITDLKSMEVIVELPFQFFERLDEEHDYEA